MQSGVLQNCPILTETLCLRWTKWRKQINRNESEDSINTSKETKMTRRGTMLNSLLCHPLKLFHISSIMCLQKAGPVLHNHTVPHIRLDWLNSVSGISLTEAKSDRGRAAKKRKREGQRDGEREKRRGNEFERESERFGIAAYYIVKDISLLA